MAFDVITPAKLGQVAVGIANTLVHTTPALSVSYVKNIDIANTTGAAITVTVYAGNGVATANTLLPALSIPANSILQWTGLQILNAADTIQAIASAVGCTITISGATAV